MKELLLLILSMSYVGQVFAQEVAVVAPETTTPKITEETTRIKPVSNLYDLMYLPAKGTFGGSTEFSATTLKQIIDYQSREFVNSKSNTSTLKQSLGFAYDNNSIFGASLSYQLESTTTSKFGPASTKNGQSFKDKSEKGLEDPTLYLSQRIKSQATDNFNIDTAISFSPKTGTAKSSTTNKEGNALRGGNNFEFDLNIGKKNEESSWKAQLFYSRAGEAKSEDAEVSADQSLSDAYNVFGTSFTYQWIINPNFEINLNGGIAFIGETNSSNQYSHIKNEIEGASVLAFGPVFILNYTPKATFELGISATSSDERTFKQTDTTTGGVTTLNVKETTTGNVSLTSRYEF